MIKKLISFGLVAMLVLSNGGVINAETNVEKVEEVEEDKEDEDDKNKKYKRDKRDKNYRKDKMDQWKKIKNEIKGLRNEIKKIEDKLKEQYEQAKVQWRSETKEAVIVKGEIQIILPLDSNKVIVNQQEVILDTKSGIMNDRIYVPLRFILETFGLEIEWDGETETIQINK